MGEAINVNFVPTTMAILRTTDTHIDQLLLWHGHLVVVVVNVWSGSIIFSSLSPYGYYHYRFSCLHLFLVCVIYGTPRILIYTATTSALAWTTTTTITKKWVETILYLSKSKWAAIEKWNWKYERTNTNWWINKIAQSLT